MLRGFGLKLLVYITILLLIFSITYTGISLFLLGNVEISKLLLSGLISFIVGLIFLVLAAAFIKKDVFQAVNKIKKAIDEIAEGDLTKIINIKAGDEFGDLAKSLNSLVHNFKVLILEAQQTSEQTAIASQKLRDSMSDFSQASRGIAVTVEEIAKGAEDQAEAAQETAQNTSEILKFNEDVKEKCKTTRRSSIEMGNIIKESESTMSELIKRINDSAEKNKQLSRDVLDLKERANKITHIVGVVNKIADQTNLLALNAAIEAARAGEHGRGFAVVADEVRKLAEQSSSAADEIAVLAKSIQEKVEDVVTKLDEEVQKAIENLSYTNKTKQELTNVINSSNEVIESIAEIDSLVEAQYEKLKNINELTHRIAAVTEETAASTEETVATTQEQVSAINELEVMVDRLNEFAAKLENLVKRFAGSAKLSDEQKKNINEAKKLLEALVRENGKNLLSERAKEVIRNIAAKHPQFELMFAVLSNGDLLAASMDLEVKNVYHRPWFQKAIKGETTVTEPYISSATNELCVTIVMPIYDENKKVIGVFGADLRI